MSTPENALSRHAIVLFSHGSRDPLWSAPLRAVEDRIRIQCPTLPVRSAYLELCAPDLPTAVQSLVDSGASHISIVPLFLGVGKHAREDLPRIVQQLHVQHPQVRFHLRAAIGEDPRMTQLMADIACEPPPDGLPNPAP